MKRKNSFFAASFIALLFLSTFFTTNVLGEKITIKGTVNDNYQIVTEDGQIYEVADTDKGNEVVFQNIGKTVKATGIIKDGDDGEQIITVTEYEVEDEDIEDYENIE